jgi:hypothetical protein
VRIPLLDHENSSLTHHPRGRCVLRWLNTFLPVPQPVCLPATTGRRRRERESAGPAGWAATTLEPHDPALLPNPPSSVSPARPFTTLDPATATRLDSIAAPSTLLMTSACRPARSHCLSAAHAARRARPIPLHSSRPDSAGRHALSVSFPPSSMMDWLHDHHAWR